MYSPRKPGRSALIAMLVSASVVAAGCGSDGDGDPTGSPVVTISPATLTLFVGETGTLAASVVGSTASATFASSNASVATVSSAGVVTAVSPGTATITASAGGASATAQVTVNPSSITLAPATLELDVGDSGPLTATVTGGTGHSVSWSSSNATVASVDAAGLVTAAAAGTATITASVDGQPGVEATATVTVTDRPPSVTLSGFTQGGQEVDLSNVSGVIEAQIVLDIANSASGTLEILFDDIVMSTVEIEPVGAGPGKSGSGGPSQVERVMELRTNTAGTVFDEETFSQTPNAPNRSYLAAINFIPSGGGTPVETQFAGMVTLNNPNTVLVDRIEFDGGSGTNSDGVTYNNGSMTARASFVDYNLGSRSINSMALEGLLGEITSMFRASPVAGALTIEANRNTDFSAGGVGNVEGFIEWRDATVQFTDGSEVTVPVGNRFTDLYPEFVASLAVDNRFSSSTKLESDDEIWFGAGLSLQDRISVQLGFRWKDDAFGSATVRDTGIGGAECDINLSTDMDVWDFPNVTQATDVPETTGLDLYLRVGCWDAFGNPGTVDFTKTDGTVAQVAADVTLPGAPLFLADDGLIFPGGINPAAGSRFEWDFRDVPGSAGGSSGADLSRWRLMGSYMSPMGTFCWVGTLDGTKCAPEERTFPQSEGFTPDFTEFGSIQWQFGVQGRDRAWNWGPVAVGKGVNDLVAPTLTGSLLFGAELENEETVTGLRFVDDLELFGLGVSISYKRNGLDIGFDYLAAGNVVGTPHDEEFVTEADLNFAFFFIKSIERTLPFFPFTPTGERFDATTLTAGAADHAGNEATVEEDVTEKGSPRSTSFLVGGMDSWGFGGVVPTWICNPNQGADCGTIPTSIELTAEGFTTGDFEIESAQLFRLKSFGSRNLAEPIGDRVMLGVIDFGGFKQATATTTLDASKLNPMTDFLDIFLLGFSASGDAVMGPTERINLIF